MSKHKLPAKTLGPVSARLMTELQKAGKLIFATDDAQKVYGKNRFATGDLLSELVKRRILARIKAGTYLILQTGMESTQLCNWPVIAREIAHPHLYFISHYSAMRLHGMTTHPVLDVYLTASLRRLSRQVNGLRYHFIYSKKKHFWGSETVWVTKYEKIVVSDLERTLLDGLDRPDLCGGLTEVIRGIFTKQNDVDHAKLIQYAKRFRTKAAVKRLGFVLEMLKLSDQNIIEQIRALVKSSKGFCLLDSNGPKTGAYLNRWGLRINLHLDEMKASTWA